MGRNVFCEYQEVIMFSAERTRKKVSLFALSFANGNQKAS